MGEEQDHKSFAELLAESMERAGFKSQSLVSEINRLFRRDKVSPDIVARSNIERWLDGDIPRAWQPVVAMAAALRLKQGDTDQMLKSAGKPPLHELRKNATEDEQRFLNYWAELAPWEILQKRIEQVKQDIKHLREKKVDLEFPWERPFQAPSAPDYFIGREREIELLIEEMVNAQNTRLIIGLRGMGGVGKTTLATQLAYKLKETQYFSGGILWTRFTPDTLAETVLQKFLMAFGVGQEAPDLHQKSEWIRQLLDNKKLLVVLDNVEKYSQVEWILRAQGNQTVVLITTRNQEILDELEEKGHHVKAHSLKTFDYIDGLALFKHKIKARVVDEENDLKETIDLVGGLPLALSIIAGQMAKQTKSSVALYNQRLKAKILERLFDSREPAERNVFASFELSYHTLSLLCRKLFVALSVFDGPDFSLAVIEEVIQIDALVPEMDMADLCAHSLVVAGPAESRPLPTDQDRYHLHPLLKEFAKMKLAEEQAFKAILDPIPQRVANYFAAFVSQNSQRDKYNFLDQEWGNIFGALRWAYQQQQWPLLLESVQKLTQTSDGMVGFVDAWGYWKQARDLLGWALEGIESSAGSLQEATMLIHRGNFALRQLDSENARECFDKSWAILTVLQPPSAEIILQRAYLCRSFAGLLILGDRQAALDWLRRGVEELEGVEPAEATTERGYISLILAAILAEEGKFEAAIQEVQAGLRDLPPSLTSTRINGLICLGHIFSQLGEHEKSLAKFKEGLEMAEALGDTGHQARLWESIGIEAELAGDFVAAVEHYEKALPFYRRQGDIERECGVHSNLGSVYTKLGVDEQAFIHFNTAMKLIAQKIHSETKLVQAHPLIKQEAYLKTNLARLYLDRNQPDEAEINLKRAAEICEHLELLFVWPTVLSWQAEVARLTGDLTGALRLVEEALSKAKTGRDLLGEGIAWRVKGDILSARAKPEPARTAYEASLAILDQQDQYEAARSRVALARHYLANGQKSEAKTLLTEALITMERLAARREIELIQDLLDKGMDL